MQVDGLTVQARVPNERYCQPRVGERAESTEHPAVMNEAVCEDAGGIEEHHTQDESAMLCNMENVPSQQECWPMDESGDRQIDTQTQAACNMAEPELAQGHVTAESQQLGPDAATPNTAAAPLDLSIAPASTPTPASSCFNFQSHDVTAAVLAMSDRALSMHMPGAVDHSCTHPLEPAPFQCQGVIARMRYVLCYLFRMFVDARLCYGRVVFRALTDQQRSA